MLSRNAIFPVLLRSYSITSLVYSLGSTIDLQPIDQVPCTFPQLSAGFVFLSRRYLK
jgi:hypothetical protein